MSALQDLVGVTISKIESLHDYVQITFKQGTILHVFNSHHFDGGSASSFEGKLIESIEEHRDRVLITMEGGSLSIGLEDDDYYGPEAMVLLRMGEPHIVWS